MLCDAIRERLVVTFRYKGKSRTVEPHIVGNNADMKEVLSAWQTSGGSGVGWRDFFVSEISDLMLTDVQFSGPRDGYNPNDATLVRIICRI